MRMREAISMQIDEEIPYPLPLFGWCVLRFVGLLIFVTIKGSVEHSICGGRCVESS